MQPTLYFLLQILADLIAHPASGGFNGILSQAKVGLFIGAPAIDQSTVFADLTEATFDGYAQQTVTWGVPYLDQSGNVVLVGQNAAFIATDATIAQQVTGAFITDGGGTPKLLAAQLFSQALNITEASQGVTVPPTVILPNGSYGQLAPLG